MGRGIKGMKQLTAPGHVYHTVLRCEYCDYTQEIGHSGPNMDRGRWKRNVSRYCQNPKCWAYKLVRLVPSLK